jgi:hypothetical protein
VNIGDLMQVHTYVHSCFVAEIPIDCKL